MGTKLWVVVTTVNDGEQDNFSDVVLITDDEAEAMALVDKLKNHEPIKNIDYNLLASYESAAYFSRDLNSLNCWGG